MDVQQEQAPKADTPKPAAAPQVEPDQKQASARERPLAPALAASVRRVQSVYGNHVFCMASGAKAKKPEYLAQISEMHPLVLFKPGGGVRSAGGWLYMHKNQSPEIIRDPKEQAKHLAGLLHEFSPMDRAFLWRRFCNLTHHAFRSENTYSYIRQPTTLARLQNADLNAKEREVLQKLERRVRGERGVDWSAEDARTLDALAPKRLAATLAEIEKRIDLSVAAAGGLADEAAALANLGSLRGPALEKAAAELLAAVAKPEKGIEGQLEALKALAAERTPDDWQQLKTKLEADSSENREELAAKLKSIASDGPLSLEQVTLQYALVELRKQCRVVAPEGGNFTYQHGRVLFKIEQRADLLAAELMADEFIKSVHSELPWAIRHRQKESPASIVAARIAKTKERIISPPAQEPSALEQEIDKLAARAGAAEDPALKGALDELLQSAKKPDPAAQAQAAAVERQVRLLSARLGREPKLSIGALSERDEVRTAIAQAASKGPLSGSQLLEYAVCVELELRLKELPAEGPLKHAEYDQLSQIARRADGIFDRYRGADEPGATFAGRDAALARMLIGPEGVPKVTQQDIDSAFALYVSNNAGVDHRYMDLFSVKSTRSVLRARDFHLPPEKTELGSRIPSEHWPPLLDGNEPLRVPEDEACFIPIDDMYGVLGILKNDQSTAIIEIGRSSADEYSLKVNEIHDPWSYIKNSSSVYNIDAGTLRVGSHTLGGRERYQRNVSDQDYFLRWSRNEFERVHEFSVLAAYASDPSMVRKQFEEYIAKEPNPYAFYHDKQTLGPDTPLSGPAQRRKQYFDEKAVPSEREFRRMLAQSLRGRLQSTDPRTYRLLTGSDPAAVFDPQSVKDIIWALDQAEQDPLFDLIDKHVVWNSEHGNALRFALILDKHADAAAELADNNATSADDRGRLLKLSSFLRETAAETVGLEHARQVAEQGIPGRPQKCDLVQKRFSEDESFTLAVGLRLLARAKEELNKEGESLLERSLATAPGNPVPSRIAPGDDPKEFLSRLSGTLSAELRAVNTRLDRAEQFGGDLQFGNHLGWEKGFAKWSKSISARMEEFALDDARPTYSAERYNKALGILEGAYSSSLDAGPAKRSAQQFIDYYAYKFLEQLEGSGLAELKTAEARANHIRSEWRKFFEFAGEEPKGEQTALKVNPYTQARTLNLYQEGEMAAIREREARFPAYAQRQAYLVLEKRGPEDEVVRALAELPVLKGSE